MAGFADMLMFSKSLRRWEALHRSLQRVDAVHDDCSGLSAGLQLNQVTSSADRPVHNEQTQRLASPPGEVSLSRALAAGCLDGQIERMRLPLVLRW